MCWDILMHLNSQGVAGLDAAAGGNSAAVLVATNIVAHDILDGRVGQRHAHASLAVLSLLAFRSINLFTGGKTYLVNAIDPQVLESSVSGDLLRRKSRHEGEDGRLHCRFLERMRSVCNEWQCRNAVQLWSALKIRQGRWRKTCSLVVLYSRSLDLCGPSFYDLHDYHSL